MADKMHSGCVQSPNPIGSHKRGREGRGPLGHTGAARCRPRRRWAQGRATSAGPPPTAGRGAGPRLLPLPPPPPRSPHARSENGFKCIQMCLCMVSVHLWWPPVRLVPLSLHSTSQWMSDDNKSVPRPSLGTPPPSLTPLSALGRPQNTRTGKPYKTPGPALGRVRLTPAAGRSRPRAEAPGNRTFVVLRW